MILLVCGGRSFTNWPAMEANLAAIHAATPITILIQGGQSEPDGYGGKRGADYFAEQWAERNEIACLRVPAKWKTQGRPAGPIRNSCQLEIIGRPDAFLAAPGGAGTRDMVGKARRAGVREITFTEDSPSPVCSRGVL